MTKHKFLWSNKQHFKPAIQNEPAAKLPLGVISSRFRIKESLTITGEHQNLPKRGDTEMWNILIPVTLVVVVPVVLSMLWGMQNLIDCPYEN
jgi:hypothetical protein